MNQVIDQLMARKSVRAFDPRPIGDMEKNLIIEAATAAPTAGNQQLYTILDIVDPALKARLSVTCDHQPFIQEAPMALIFLADCKKWYDAFWDAGCAPRRPGLGDLMLAVDDALIAAQNAVTAAWSLGIGSCYIGDIMENCETHREILHLPECVFPAAMVVFGYPAPGQLERKKPIRQPIACIVHQNTYRPMAGEALRQALAHQAGAKPYEAYMQAFCQRKYHSDFALEMNRSVEKYLNAYCKN